MREREREKELMEENKVGNQKYLLGKNVGDEVTFLCHLNTLFRHLCM